MGVQDQREMNGDVFELILYELRQHQKQLQELQSEVQPTPPQVCDSILVYLSVVYVQCGSDAVASLPKNASMCAQHALSCCLLPQVQTNKVEPPPAQVVTPAYTSPSIHTKSVLGAHIAQKFHKQRT